MYLVATMSNHKKLILSIIAESSIGQHWFIGTKQWK